MWQMNELREVAVQKILECRDTGCDGITLLRLSTELRVIRIRDATIQALRSSLRPTEQIQLGIELQVQSWLITGCTNLVRAQDSISMEDEKVLGRKTTSKLFRIRDGYLKLIWKTYHRNTAEAFVSKQIEEMFAEEITSAVWISME
jgi:hypothetical protein